MTAARFVVIALAAAVGCRGTDSVQPMATVNFSLDAPLCGMALPAQFFIDSVLVGTDTFRVNLAPNHLTTGGFLITPGTHVLGARVALGPTPVPWPSTPDTVVTALPGTTLTRVLPFYCS